MIEDEGIIGILYLLHFDKPLAHAKHYLGFATDQRRFEQRIENHRLGRGAKITDALRKAGIGFHVVWTRPGTRTEERRLKGHSSTRYCPVCKGVVPG